MFDVAAVYERFFIIIDIHQFKKKNAACKWGG